MGSTLHPEIHYGGSDTPPREKFLRQLPASPSQRRGGQNPPRSDRSQGRRLSVRFWERPGSGEPRPGAVRCDDRASV